MHRDAAYLLDILLHAKDAQNFTSNMDKEAFFEDYKCQLAVIRCLEVMGEAVKRLSKDIQKEHPEIPWTSIAGMRDILIHAYNKVDLEEVWNTIKQDIPMLIPILEKLVPPKDEM